MVFWVTKRRKIITVIKFYRVIADPFFMTSGRSKMTNEILVHYYKK